MAPNLGLTMHVNCLHVSVLFDAALLYVCPSYGLEASCSRVVRPCVCASSTFFCDCLANVISRSRSLYVVVRLSVCLSSVTFVHPTQVIDILGNVSTPFSILAIFDLSITILRRSPQGNPSVGGGVKRIRVAKYSDFGPFQGYISETVQDRS